jgi:prepilin-type N-terminal cleavage/methylation domain-containing protein
MLLLRKTFLCYYFYMKFSAQSSAFTLIELLVVVSLITIMTGALIPSFTGYLDDQNLKQAQEAVKNDLRSVQNKALAGSLTDNPNVKYWGIRFNSDSGTYTYLTSVNAACDSPDNHSSSEALPGSIVVRNAGTTCVFFSVANGDLAGNNSVVVGKSGDTGNKCRSVAISANGLIVATQGKVVCP